MNNQSKFRFLSLCLIAGLISLGNYCYLFAQGTCQRIMEQDSSLNNLVDPPGYETGQLGKLGKVDKFGSGSQNMILIAGLGFGGESFDEWMTQNAGKYTMYSITLPGFGGTPAPPSPPESTSFGKQPWTNAAFGAIEKLILDEKIEQPIIVGHWLTGTQLALRLALKHPDKVKSVIIISGSACFVPTDTSQYKAHPPIEQRIASIDLYMVPKWYKTVTRVTWDDNNFLPGDYAVNPVRGLRLWREAAEPPLHVWVRYLNEFYAQDISLKLDSLTVPTLLLYPGLDNLYYDPGQNYMHAYCITSWAASAPGNKMIQSVTIPNSRVCMWFDQPEKFDEEVEKFLKSLD
jgi:pimeloyl-ACP methyl ester carboxylesterase